MQGVFSIRCAGPAALRRRRVVICVSSRTLDFFFLLNSRKLTIGCGWLVFQEHAVYVGAVLSLVFHDLLDDGDVLERVYRLAPALALPLRDLYFLLLLELLDVGHDRVKTVLVLLLSLLVNQVSYLALEWLSHDVVFE